MTLGDSVPAGANCSCPPFGDVYGALLTEHRGQPANVHNFGIDGQTSATLKAELSAGGSPEAQAIAGADIVTITVGANDFDESLVDSPACADLSCYHGDLAALRGNLTAVISAVRRLAPGRAPTILVTGYWNVFLDGAVGASHGSAYQHGSDRLTVAANLII
ncbi:MAG TPA: GDSL-type esterase/lipase family protein, partial [Mycobacteriales bacterium]|nr:GDSL-type esterase/lipase family protein [Mycobacteriales bacterium]